MEEQCPLLRKIFGLPRNKKREQALKAYSLKLKLIMNII
jgi:hypothetical protein